MKRFLCFLVFVAVFSIAAYAINNRYDDKRIRFRKDWVEFSEAQEKDLPKTQEKILKRIMDKAASDKASDDIDSHTKTNMLRFHSSEVGPDGEFAKQDEWINTKEEPVHDELCQREQLFLKSPVFR